MVSTNIKKIIKEDTSIYTNCLINKIKSSYSKLDKEYTIYTHDFNKDVTLKDALQHLEQQQKKFNCFYSIKRLF